MHKTAEPMTRRSFVGLSLAAGATLASHAAAHELGSITDRYPDPNLRSLDPRFDALIVGNTPIIRIDTGNLWAEGPAWNGVGRYLVWSDIPADTQRRWLEEDGHVSKFRQPSGKSNGNTFDSQGRQLSCQHLLRRVVRYEHDGSVTVLADNYNGKRLNAPNDVVVHPNDGAIWFTDPGYGIGWYEGQPGELEIKEAVYRIDARSGKIALVTDDIDKPNGLCFSPDYGKLYVADSGAPRHIKVWNVDGGSRLGGGRPFASVVAVEGQPGGVPDGIRADTAGNVWAGVGWLGAQYDGVYVFSPQGDHLGRVVLPEICSNLCFGGSNRNRLFMTASQSVYAMYVRTQGAHNG
jgi:gluconolactonase